MPAASFPSRGERVALHHVSESLNQEIDRSTPAFHYTVVVFIQHSLTHLLGTRRGRSVEMTVGYASPDPTQIHHRISQAQWNALDNDSKQLPVLRQLTPRAISRQKRLRFNAHRLCKGRAGSSLGEYSTKVLSQQSQSSISPQVTKTTLAGSPRAKVPDKTVSVAGKPSVKKEINLASKTTFHLTTVTADSQLPPEPSSVLPREPEDATPSGHPHHVDEDLIAMDDDAP
eukprot:3940859-Rhodomonas_salina.1